MVPLTTLLASCVTNAGAIVVSHPKVTLDLISIIIDLRNAVLPLIKALALCDTDANTSGITWTNKSCCTLVVQPVVLT